VVVQALGQVVMLIYMVAAEQDIAYTVEALADFHILVVRALAHTQKNLVDLEVTKGGHLREQVAQADHKVAIEVQVVQLAW
jgi:hypothetical protein